MISLFVRSYPKDFEWLHYSVKSMRKNLKDVDDKVLVVPNGSRVPNDISSFFTLIVPVREHYPGYIAQQIDKIQAYKYCKHTHILFSDSDCIYNEPYSAKSLTLDNRIKLYMTNYSELSGDVLCWQSITEAATNIQPSYEYMRCFPIMHHREVCKYLHEDISTLYTYLNKAKPNAFSEFNALGIVAHTYFPKLYHFLDTSQTLPAITAKQYWSWGGISESLRKELETL